MKTRHIPQITKWWLTVILVLALLPFAVMAKDTPTLDEQLIKAAGPGDLELVKTLLDKGADVNARDNRGKTALMSAVWGGDLKVVQLLLDWGADANAKTIGGRTALMEAASRDRQLEDNWYFGLWPLFRALLHGAAVGRYPDGREDPQIVRLLIRKGADVNAKDQDGWTALKRAQKRGSAEIVEMLKAHGAKE
jgi:ankyrin repeat protein